MTDRGGGRLGGRVALVTGGASGQGEAEAKLFAAEGANVVVADVDDGAGRAVVRALGGDAHYLHLDVSIYDHWLGAVHEIDQWFGRLDVLVNNAGIWLDAPERQLSQDGHEMHFQVNYLSGFLLTRELLPLLSESAPSRIVNVSSVAQRPIDFEDVMLTRGYDDGRAYAQSKLAQIMLTLDLAAELEGRGVIAVAVHPASMMNTDMVLERGARPRSTVEEGAAAVLRAVTSAGVESGAYYRGLERARAHDQAYDEEARARLRRLSERLTGS